MGTRFRLLGPVEVDMGGRPVDIGHARQRSVLVALLVDPGRPVPVDQLIERVWGETAPARAPGTLYSYVSRLRTALQGGTEITRSSHGYVIDVTRSAVDLHEFRDLAARASTEPDEQAAETYRRALALWRGAPSGDTPWLAALARELERERCAVELAAFDTALRLGRHHEVLAAVHAASDVRPLDEHLAGQLMIALYRCGRQADALAVYRQVGHRLADALGVDPGPDLRDLHERILRSCGSVAAPDVGGPTPAQLPAPATHFTGRDTDLAALADLLAGHDDTRLTIGSLEGTAGVGKTTLAVRFAHEAAHAFPGGQLFINLRGYGPGDPVPAGTALTALLQGLGVPAQNLTPDVDARSALWRTHTAGRRVLVVLDNASDTTQIRDLLPGPSCLVLLTSRTRLRGLAVREGARRIPVDRMPAEEAMRMLRSIAGEERVAAEPDQARRMVDVCARLPLAVRIAGERVGDDPSMSLGQLVEEMADTDPMVTFDIADDEESDLRSVFDRSYRALDELARRMFRLLGAQEAADFTVESAAALTGATIPDTRAVLGRLLARHVVEQPHPGRYQFHDLMRGYARTVAEADETPEALRAATARLLAWYLHSVKNASLRMNPARELDVPVPVPEGVRPMEFATADEAVRWSDAERSNLVDLIVRTDDPFHPWLLHFPSVLFSYVVTRAHNAEDWDRVNRHVLAIAKRAGHFVGQIGALNNLSVVLSVLGRHDEAAATLEEFLQLARSAGDRGRECSALNNLSVAHRRAGNASASLGYARRQLEIATATGDPRLLLTALTTIASAYDLNGAAEEAIQHAEKALELGTMRNGRYNRASALRTLGAAHSRLGRLDEAVAHYERAVAVYRELGVTYLECEGLVQLGDVHDKAGNGALAGECWRAAVALHRQTGQPGVELVLARLARSGT